MYTQFANWYDLHYRSIKDYESECQRLAYLLGKFDPRPSLILDVCCGTGEHARILRESHGFDVDGIDLEPRLAAIAQAKNPEREFHVADMRSFSLPKRYDAIICLFSSIGYAETDQALNAAIENFARHINPWGWLILEPWVEPGEWEPELVKNSRSFDESQGIEIRQIRTGRSEGSVSVIDIEYRISTPDEERRFRETHRLGLFSKAQIMAALQRNGFQTRLLPKGVLPHAVYVAKLQP